MLDRIFAKFGLGNKEVEIYLTLLEAGASTVGELSKKVDIPRTTLYSLLDSLAVLGLVVQGERDGTKLWHAEPPTRVSELIDSRMNTWQETKEKFAGILTHLESRHVTDIVSPHFTYFEGREGVKNVLRDMLRYREIVTQAFWPIRDMIEILGEDFFNELNVRRIRQKLYTQAIWPKAKVVDIKRNIFLGVGKEFYREIREAPKGIECSMGYWAYHNKVAFVSSRQESFGFIVESAEFRQLLKTQFEVLWQMSEPIEVPVSETGRFLDRVK